MTSLRVADDPRILGYHEDFRRPEEVGYALKRAISVGQPDFLKSSFSGAPHYGRQTLLKGRFEAKQVRNSAG